jgi:hypothetical protein
MLPVRTVPVVPRSLAAKVGTLFLQLMCEGLRAHGRAYAQRADVAGAGSRRTAMHACRWLEALTLFGLDGTRLDYGGRKAVPDPDEL